MLTDLLSDELAFTVVNSADVEPLTDAAHCARWLVRMSGQPLRTLQRGRSRVAFARLFASYRAHCAALGWAPMSPHKLACALTACGIRSSAAPDATRHRQGRKRMTRTGHAGRWLPADVARWLAVTADAG